MFYEKLKKIVGTIAILMAIIFVGCVCGAFILNLNHTEVNFRRYDVYVEKHTDFQIQEISDMDTGRTYIVYDGANGCSLLEVWDSEGNNIPMVNGVLSE
jgi:hypothetical protein